MKVILFIILLGISGSLEAQMVIRVTPIGSVSSLGTGVGASFESFVGKNQRWSYILPLDYVIKQHRKEFFPRHSPYFLFSPGMKLYTGSKSKSIRHAIGLNARFGTGEIQIIDSFDSGGNTEFKIGKNSRFGGVVNNYVNCNVGEKFTFGAQVGIGFFTESGLVSNYFKSRDMDTEINIHFGYIF